MKKCPKCGAELSDDTKFYSYCCQKMEVETVTPLPPPIMVEEETPDNAQSEPTNVTAPEANAPKFMLCAMGRNIMK